MIQKISLLLALIILVCNQNHKKDDLLGIWDGVSTTDIETGAELLESDNTDYVVFKSDSLYLISDSSSDMVFAWEVKDNSIFLDELGSVYIKELTADKLIVEFDFLNKIRLELKKRR